MSVLRDSRRGIVPVTVVHVYTSNAICSLSMNSCQQFEGYQSAGDTKRQSIK